MSENDLDKRKYETCPKVLVLFGFSGRRVMASGPMQSLYALMHGAGKDFDFYFAAGVDMRPHSQKHAPLSQWYERDGFRQMWIDHNTRRWPLLIRLMAQENWDLVVLNSFFDREFTLPLLILRKLKFVSNTPVLLAPRGELAEGAMSLKAFRKRAYVSVGRFLHLFEDIWMHATADHERMNMEAMRLSGKGILQASPARLMPPPPIHLATARTLPSELRIVFLGRVSEVKNVMFALEVLRKVRVRAVFDILGPIDDSDYWHRCEALIKELPPNIMVRTRGALDHDLVLAALPDYDLMFLPTLGENFGHAINEALASGVPVLISDATPWRNLEEAGAGWDLPLDAPECFVAAIESMAVQSPETRANMRLAARAVAERKHSESDAVMANCRTLLHAIGGRYQGQTK